MNRNPWPWIALLGIGVLWGWLLLRTDHGSTPAVITAPPGPIEVTRIVVATVTETPTLAPTQTARIEYRAATNTPTAVLLLCDAADQGQTCVMLPPSPTPTAVPRMCSETTPASYAITVCRKGDGATSGKGETG
jgi:hypothetical protein